MDISPFSDLEEKMKFIVEDYNQDRPHGSMNGATPNERFYVQEIPDSELKDRLAEARAARVLENRRNTCQECLKW